MPVSAVVIVFILAFLQPVWAQAPSGLKASSASSKRIDLTWTGSASSYVLQRALVGGSFADLTTVSSAAATDTSIDPYTTYQYQVLAVTLSGRSTPSNVITVGPPPAGFTNAAPSPNSNADGNYGYNISLVLDANGDPAFAFVFADPNLDTDESDTQVLFRSWSRAQYKWNPVVTVATVGDIATTFRQSISLARDASNGSYAIAAENGNDGFIHVYDSPDGKSWKPTGTIATDNAAEGPSLALANGNLYLAYVISADGLQYTTGKLSADTSTWQSTLAPIPANTANANNDTAPSLALDAGGMPAIAYWVPDTTQTYNEILYYWRPPSGTPIKVLDTQNQQTDGYAKLLFYGSDPRIALYAQRQDADFGVGLHAVHSNDGGNTWTTPVVIPPDGNSSTDYPFDFALGSKDQGAIFFGQNSGTGDAVCGNPKLSLSTDLTKWKTCAAADVDTTGQYQVYPGSVAAVYGNNDKLYLLWWDTGDSGTGNGVLMYREPPAIASETPTITTQNGVVNGATFQPGIVGGSWVTIYGANFTNVTETWANADFSNGLPTSLGGVSVNINGRAAAVYFVSPTQLNVQAPSPLSGNVSVQAFHNGAGSNTVTADAVANAPGLFSYAVGSTVFPAAVFPDGTILGDPALNAQTEKARPGARLQLYATGLTSSPAGQVISAAMPVSDPVTVKIGSAKATVEFVGLVAVGEFQINIVVPTLPSGDYPITVSIDSQTSPDTVMFPIQ
ncbi:MAG TPA: IPT/TIG domain-containing protein [Bryobacteraceae bacterium]|nr:IPT/TIG domain-containing protein [Bryobacteraceae bacterium]